MGYTTDFSGEFTVTPPMGEEMQNFINGLCQTRRMKRQSNDKFGVDSEFYIGQGKVKPLVIDNNGSPSTQPGLWCQWEAPDENYIEWDGGEKFYRYIDWLVYLIEKVLKPNGHTVNGEVIWSGEETGDTGKIIVTDNKVETLRAFSSERELHEPTPQMRTDVPFVLGVTNFTKPKKTVKLRVTTFVEVETDLEETSEIIDEFSQETDYNFTSTDSVKVVDTELIDCQLT